MTRHSINPRTLFVAALSVSLAILYAAPAVAQSTDELFDPNAMQELRLTINTRDVRELRANYGNDTYFTADMQWRNIRVRNAGVRSRGGASRNGIKLGLRVDFDRYVTGQRFLGLKSIVLKNLWQDGSMMHERLAMSFFARMGQPASRESFCRLYINNEFQGLYVIVESVDKAYLARTIGENSGYLYSYQFKSPFHGEYLGEEFEPYKSRFEPQTHEKEGDTKLYLPIHDWLREVNAPDDAVWRERVEQYVDLTQFMTHVAIESFLAENDGLLGAEGMNNFYLYRPEGTNRHRFLPWDKDNSFLVVDYSILPVGRRERPLPPGVRLPRPPRVVFPGSRIVRQLRGRGRLARGRGRPSGGAGRRDRGGGHAEAVLDRRFLRVGRVPEAVCAAAAEARAGAGGRRARAPVTVPAASVRQWISPS